MTVRRKVPPSASDPTDPILNLKETADRLRVNQQTVRTLIRRGKLRASKVGNQFRFRQSWVEAYIDAGGV